MVQFHRYIRGDLQVSTTELRRRAKKTIDELSGDRLKFVNEFLAYVKERQSDEATTELLQIPGFSESFRRGERDLRSGKTINWR
jgi:hypothetical protein